MPNAHKSPIRNLLLVALTLFWFPLACQAQFLYNPTKDAKGQQALALANDVTNSQVFDKMIDNLDLLSKASSERFFDDAERQMRANLAALRTWNDVANYTKNLQTQLQLNSPGDATPAQISAAVAAVTAQTSKAQAALQTLQTAANAKFPAPDKIALIGTWFARIGDLGEFVAFAQQFTSAQQAPADFLDVAQEVTSLAAALGKMYSGFNVALSQTPDMVILEAQLDLLATNEDHLTQMAKILTQREIDLADTRHLIQQVNAGLAFIQKTIPASNPISNSIAAQLTAKDADPKVLEAMIFALYNAGALVARDTTPKRLASLRLADEQHRYSVRASAVAARSYETLVGTGVQRLATYYQGGIKIESLAQIASAVATLGLIPTIAVK